MSNGIWQDWDVNPRDARIKFILGSFRFAQKLHRWPKAIRWLAAPYLFVYQLVVWWELGIELNHKATVGPRLRLHHGYGLVVHEGAVIGSDCILRHAGSIVLHDVPAGCTVAGNPARPVGT